MGSGPTRTELIAQQLRTARERAGLSQEEVAQRVGASRAAYGHWERGRTPINIDDLFALANLLDLSISTLLGVENSLAPDESILLEAYRKLNGSPHQARVLVAFLDMCRMWTHEDLSPVAGDPILMDLFVARQSETGELSLIKQGKIPETPEPTASEPAASEQELLGYLQELGPQGRAVIQRLLKRLDTAS